MAPFFGAGLYVAVRGPGGTTAPTPPGCPCAMLGAFAVCGPMYGPSLARLGPLWLPSLGLRSGCGCRDKPGTAAPGNPSPGLLPCLSGARPARRSGPGGPPPASLRPSAAASGRLGSRFGRLPVWLRPCFAAPSRVVGLAWLRACCPRVAAARLGGSPRPGLFPSLLPPGGAAAAGRLFAALVRLRRRRAPGALGVPLRRGKDYAVHLAVDNLV